MRFHRFVLTGWLFFLVFAFLISSSPFPSQNPPADAAEISRDLLYLAPHAIRFSGDAAARVPVLISRRFSLQLSPSGGAPKLDLAAGEPPPELAPHGKLTIAAAGGEYTVTPHSDDDQATLSLSRKDDSEPLVVSRLWNREQLAEAWLPYLQSLHKGITADSLRQDLEVGDPILYDSHAEGNSIWIAVGHSIGEGELGLGTIARFEIADKRVRLFQPKELATCAVTQLALAADKSVWIASRRQHEGTILPCHGLLRLDPASGQVQAFAPAGTPLAKGIITAVAASDRLWVASDSGTCSTTKGDSWQCWRITPSVTVFSAATLTNKPGEKSGSELKPGDYEVLWANQNFLEIATKDSYDAWLAADDLAEAAARNFDTEPYKLLNTSSSFSPIRPLTKPGGEALEGTLVYRAPLEKLPTPQGTPAGWLKIRIHAGWIERGKLEIVPQLVPVESKP